MIKLPYDELPTKIVNRPSEFEFKKLVESAKEPFKVIGSLDHWELYKKLSKCEDSLDKCDYLSTLAHDEQVYYSALAPEYKGIFGLNKDLVQNFSFKGRKATFPSFMKEIKKYISDPSLGNLYLQSTPIKDLNDRLGNLDLFKGFKPMSEAGFWIGTGNQFVSLHNDPLRNMIAIFSGRKRVIMFPPEELPNLYPAPFDKRSGGVITSLVNAFNPDLQKFPNFSQALKTVKVAILNPGEFLYLPPLWWHAVEGEGFNIGINCWFKDGDDKNNLGKLYVPAESLMLDINDEEVSNAEKNVLYENFVSIIDADSIKMKSTKKIEFKVETEAKKIVRIINSSPISEQQKNLWRTWVKVFALHYIFCLKGNPFPVLEKGEYIEMIKRFKSTKAKRSIQNIYGLGLMYISQFFMRKKKSHSVVPL